MHFFYVTSVLDVLLFTLTVKKWATSYSNDWRGLKEPERDRETERQRERGKRGGGGKLMAMSTVVRV